MFTRFIALAVLLFAPLSAFAQDMPLFTIIKSGEGWVKGDRVKSRIPEGQSGINFNCQAISPDGATMYIGWNQGQAVYALPLKADGKLEEGYPVPYAPLRVRKAYDNSREALVKLKADPLRLAVTALTVDSEGRIYAATPNDVQIFDPTGRLCGVLSLPADGEPDRLEWEGEKKDTLVMTISEQKWTRKMLATGK